MLKAISRQLLFRSFAAPSLYVFSRSQKINRPQKEPKEKKEQKEQSKEAQPVSITSKFTDKILQETKEKPITTGRSWRASELRIKSTQDLHKLWYVCVRQKNLVLADQLAKQHDVTFVRKAGKIRRFQKLQQTMSRILYVINEREKVKKQYRKKLQQEYILKKKTQLQSLLAKEPQALPEITFEMLKSKYQALRRGVDNTEYLEAIWKRDEETKGRHKRAEERVSKLDSQKEFQSFWQYEMTIGQRPTQNQILKSHIKNWKSLNLKQRKIILGFLNARRSKDAKSQFIKELKILGQKIAYEEAKERTQSTKTA